MKEQSQIHLIFKLESIRSVIINTSCKDALLALAQKAHDVAFPVPINKEYGYKNVGKEGTLFILQNEIGRYKTSNEEIEIIQFQISSTILMLMLQFIDGTLSEMKLKVKQYKKNSLSYRRKKPQNWWFFPVYFFVDH